VPHRRRPARAAPVGQTGPVTQMDRQEINRTVVELFRSGGELPHGMHRERLVLLTTTGARTGRAHVTPIMFHPDGDRLLVIASNMGSARHPDWYRNLVAHPRVTVEVGDERYPAVASPLAGEERERVWDLLKRNYPFFADHEAQTGREIPVVALTRT
jgi:deazaflavin-dependent oxidoreductase (nitroreductase family)